ncbi:bifunctional histidinol-phosphatase/imidazoleglycerol-phosphate dehydratase HisB [Blochmannia endosymbiont of Colobopsis nipponica]|uniref:bifunctional histidinol-phosphatase/imidazoleglycerol-phosphate dehydratase HisB n=1 Tax=Blochmannia endosymbiont of Colobopsis nipponica TaxID=2681987 RepID=UPI00178597B4|nr:bifunctional histidinol-phosphatase/imidazoleglycerol-phosphate dehydratase HisB [Blochmannia endosymbiont of Colobopsis nipponica]QOI10996.1 bifunctional histidinol-phosphatase/imidazoleglycerol-phosphate dehydratase HisB [Blochmannia endosymbiont of Colobopsis nipponica]
MTKKILFIDRDGTLIYEPLNNFKVDHIEKIALQPYVIPALLELQKAKFTLIMISNQDGLGTPDFPQKAFDKAHNFLMKIFNSQGIKFEKILICPHYSNAQCDCRKPKTTLITSWLNPNQLNKFKSYVIGDRETDMILAKNLGIQGLAYHPNNLNWKMISKKLTKLNRSAEINRISNETKINIQIWLDQRNNTHIDTGIKFFDHMLQQIATHAKISMNIKAIGDLCVDDHHTIEDTGLVLGKVLNKALGNRKGINRFGFILPMDECLASCVLDISGRPYFKYDVQYNSLNIGSLNIAMIEHFFRSLSYSMGCTLHLSSTKSNNDHHIAEGLFKAFGCTLNQAIRIEDGEEEYIVSTKGILE